MLTINKNEFLSKNLKIPKLGFGTYELEKDKKSAEYLSNLIINEGLRLIDTASFYDTEEVVGKAIKIAI